VPVIPVALWGSHRILTKAHKPSLGRKNYPITIAYGEPYLIDKGADVALEEDRLRQKIADLLHSIQETYPDSPVDTWWGPARLGGTAPTIEEAAIINARRKAERAEKKNKKMNKKKRASN
jgi:1-acyl-sn-glycerol-3-phosphate acyltransferase